MAEDRLGARLRQVRELKGWSLATTAAAAKISPAYVQKLERGDVAAPSPHKLRALAKALDIDYAELMKLAGYTPEPTEGVGVNVVAQTLIAEGVTEEDLSEIVDYVRLRRQHRARR